MPNTPCYTEYETGLYTRRHNPFINFNSVATNPSRCAKIVPSTQFALDTAHNSLPNYSLYIPNVVNDGQNSTLDVVANWLVKFTAPILNSDSSNKTLVVAAFARSASGPDTPTWAILIGNVLPASVLNTTDHTNYTHYSLLSTVEANWNLSSLGLSDLNAPTFFKSNVTNTTNTTNVTSATNPGPTPNNPSSIYPCNSPNIYYCSGAAINAPRSMAVLLGVTVVLLVKMFA